MYTYKWFSNTFVYDCFIYFTITKDQEQNYMIRQDDDDPYYYQGGLQISINKKFYKLNFPE